MLNRYLKPLPKFDSISEEKSHLRLRTLVWLRWFALLGQAITISYAYWGLGFVFPVQACLAIIGLSIFLNIWLRIQFPTAKRLNPPYVLLTLSYDIIQLALLLHLTGGMQNPFAFFLVIPVIISATTQPSVVTIILGVLSIICMTVLTFFYQPLPHLPGQPINYPAVYMFGEWAAAAIGLAFVSFYVWRISSESTQMSNALAATELVLARVHQLSAIDGLATAAAHELGTPLATISLVSKELLNESDPESPEYEDLELLNSQAVRCRDILAELSKNKKGSDSSQYEMTLSDLLSETAETLNRNVKNLDIKIGPGPGTERIGPISKPPVILRDPAILYALGNIMSNALDFAREDVIVAGEWSASKVWVTITDDGEGFDEDVIDMLGEPYVTTRPAGQIDLKDRGEAIGMGLGFFIAKTLLEKSGAKVELWNSELPHLGAVIRVTWKRQDIDLALNAFQNTQNYYFPDSSNEEQGQSK